MEAPYEERPQHHVTGGSPGVVDRQGARTLFEDYVGTDIEGNRGRYHIKPSCEEYGDLVIFPAVSRDGDVCEAQFFKKVHLPPKLYQARRKRIQRLKRSSNHLEELNREGVRILVSRVPEYSSQNCRRCRLMGTAGAEAQYRCCAEEVPARCCGGGGGGERDGSNLGSHKLPNPGLSFAEVAASRPIA